MASTLVFSDDLLKSALAVGGELAAEDRQSEAGQGLPFWSVIGRNSKEANYRAEVNGRMCEVSRAGEFKRKDENGDFEFVDGFYPIAIVDARIAKTLFVNDKPACKGISTKGLSAPVSVDPNGKMGAGFNCDTCPFDRWNWQRSGGPEGRVYSPDTGKPIAQQDLCKASLQLWCLDLVRDEWCIVQFSAGSLKYYREVVREVESKGVKMHAIKWTLMSEPYDNGASAAPTYAPKLEAIGALDPETFERVNEKRAELVSKALAAGQVSQGQLLPPEQKALDVTRYDSLDAAMAALPARSAFNNPPLISVVSGDGDPNDPFMKEQ